jgi:hypothetical protein
VISEYKPYRAMEYSMHLEVMQTQHSGAESRLSRYGTRTDRSSLLNSGLRTRSGMGIRLVIVRLVQGVEHLNYACHP